MGSQDLGAKSPNIVTAGPWIGRDSYIAETAVLIDRLTAKVERLERREDSLNKQVGELIEHAQQTSRFQALAESLRNSREYKVDEMARCLKDAKGRLETIEGPRAAYNGTAFKSIVQIDQKLAELAGWELRARQMERNQRMAGILVAVAAALFVASAVMQFI
jgi:phage shock protein A